jgi:iron complex transport system substrate-binding protein
MAAVAKPIVVLVAVLVWATALAAPGRSVHAQDDTGATIELAAPARRIVSLAPHTTELLFAAGAGNAVVGVVAGSDHPDAARRLPVIGDVQTLDLERIVALAPDLVVTWPYTTPAQVAKLKARGIPVFTTDPSTIEGIAANVEALGRLAGSADTAEAAASGLRARVAALRAGARGQPSLPVFYEIWHAPLFTVGRTHLITQAIAACGGQNVFAGLALPAPQVSVEAVLAAKPDAIVAGSDRGERPEWLDAWRRWPQLPAVRYGNLDVVDANLLHRPGPRFVDGMAALCATLAQARARRGTLTPKRRYAGTKARVRPDPSSISARPNSAESLAASRISSPAPGCARPAPIAIAWSQ